MTIDTDTLIQVLLAVIVGSGSGVYAAIRADLARLHENVRLANKRIDRLQDQLFK